MESRPLPTVRAACAITFILDDSSVQLPMDRRAAFAAVSVDCPAPLRPFAALPAAPSTFPSAPLASSLSRRVLLMVSDATIIRL